MTEIIRNEIVSKIGNRPAYVYSNNIKNPLDVPRVSMEEKDVLVLKWDGSDLGDIGSHITHILNFKNITYYYLLASFITSKPTYHMVSLKEYKDSVPLICDELKPLFNLSKIGRHKVTIASKEYIMDRFHNQESKMDPEYTKIYPHITNSVKLCYTFRWIMGLTLSHDSSLIIRKYPNGLITAISSRENNLDYSDLKRGSKLSQRCLKLWFNNDNEDIDKTVKLMINNRDLIFLRFDIDRIVRRVDKDMVWWTAFIIERLSWQMSPVKLPFSSIPISPDISKNPVRQSIYS
jgi:hypothetical protein